MKKITEMLWFLEKNRKKSAVKHSIEKRILLKFVNLSPTFCPRLLVLLILVFLHKVCDLLAHVEYFLSVKSIKQWNHHLVPLSFV